MRPHSWLFKGRYDGDLLNEQEQNSVLWVSPAAVIRLQEESFLLLPWAGQQLEDFLPATSLV